MQPLPFFLPFTVEALTGHIKTLLEGDDTLRDVWVEGEVSNFSRPQSGHCYFSLKDSAARIQCVMWRSTAVRIARLPENGQRVLAHGRVSVYEPQGAYQLYVDEVLPAGVGDLYIRLEQLKARLEAEGLFAYERKRPLPEFPRHIGVVTSPTGAALRDILHVLQRRYPSVRVTLAPTQVQGVEAADQIVAALQRLNAHTDCDVIILARGGGSPEELQPFNEESVARAIYQSRIPVISGVGHETDVTIADLVADWRAPTPTAAAEMATPEREELSNALQSLAERLTRVGVGRVGASAERLSFLQRALTRTSPRSQVNLYRQQTDEYQRLLTLRSQQSFAHLRRRLADVGTRLENASPEATLKRGYAIVTLKATRAVVSRSSQVSSGDDISVRMSDGQFDAKVTGDSQGQETKS